MTLDEALNELGIDREADAEGARRAYLRLLKKRKPEVDREGFMRLREAYEAVKPYFEHIELYRAIEKVANTSSIDDGSPQLIRIETSSGTVWVQKSGPAPVAPEETNADKLAADEPAPAIVEANDPVVSIEPPPVPAMEPVLLQQASFAPEVAEVVEPAALVVEPSEPAEPSIDELMKQGKFKKAARLMGAQYRNALQQGTFDVDVSAPYQAIKLLLRLHEKNRLEEARALEKDFGAWIASTGSSVRMLAGPIGVQWLMVRELSALSEKFPPTLREGIAKSVIGGKLDEMQRRASWFQLSDPDKARFAASELHRHAPTLANLLGDTLAPPTARSAATPAISGSRGSTWGIGILVVLLLNIGRLCGGSSSDYSSSYRGKSDPNAFYRPSSQSKMNDTSIGSDPAKPFDLGRMMRDESVKFDQKTQEKLIKLVEAMETAAEKLAKPEEKQIVQRIRYVRVAIEKSSCLDAEVEFRGAVTELQTMSTALKANLLPIAKKIEALLTPACAMSTTNQMVLDGGPNKKP